MRSVATFLRVKIAPFLGHKRGDFGLQKVTENMLKCLQKCLEILQILYSTLTLQAKKRLCIIFYSVKIFILDFYLKYEIISCFLRAFTFLIK
jgi:hypothetical protein